MGKPLICSPPGAMCRRMARFPAMFAAALLFCAGAFAEEPVAIDYPTTGNKSAVPAKAYPATRIDAPTGKVIFSDSSSEVTAAMCGIEGHGTAADLDAGLIDFNVPDPARAAGGSSDDQKDVGRNRYDYHSSVVLGVTLGYRF